MITPTLHVLAHGIELFLKGALIFHGGSELEARKFGHDIIGLWRNPWNMDTRNTIYSEAKIVWDWAKQNLRWTDVIGEFCAESFEEYLETLGKLHSRSSGFVLRHPEGRKEDTAAPKPHHLSPTFLRVADQYYYEAIPLLKPILANV